MTPQSRHKGVTVDAAERVDRCGLLLYQGAVVNLIRRVTIALVGLVAMSSVFAPATAEADINIWEEETEEGEEPTRFVAFTAFTQPGIVFRQADEYAGRSDNSFVVQRARLGFNAQPLWWLRLRTEVELAPTPLLADAFVDFTAHQWANVRIGQFLIPFLLAYSFNELNLGFIDRPTYTPLGGFRPFLRYLSPRDLGGMLHGRIGDLSPSSMMPVFEYQAGVFLGRGANQTGNNDDAYLYAARLRLHVLGYPEGADQESDIARNTLPRVAVGGSVYSNCDDRAVWNRGFNVDLEARWQGLYVSGAFTWFRNSRATEGQFGYDFCGLTELEEMGDSPPPLFHSTGAHFQAQYVLPDMLLPKKHELEVLARFDYVNPNSPADGTLLGGGPSTPGYVPPAGFLDSDNAPTRYRLTFGLNWFPTGEQSLRVQFNYQINREMETHFSGDEEIGGVRNELWWLQITAGI